MLRQGRTYRKEIRLFCGRRGALRRGNGSVHACLGFWHWTALWRQRAVIRSREIRISLLVWAELSNGF